MAEIVGEMVEDIKMENKKLAFVCLSALFALVVLSLSLVSASVTVHYDFYKNIINEDGTVTYTTDTISDVNIVGFVCSSLNCSTVNSNFIPARNVAGSDVNLIYPTNLQSPNGYGVYFYKAGYIDWELAANWSGTGTVSSPRKVYLAKMQTCNSPILDLSVLRETQKYKMIEINVSVGIDAKTHSAIRNAGPLDYSPTELAPYRNVNTSVTLEIRNSHGQLIRTEVKNILIPYSGSENVKFSYTFQENGTYDIRVYSDVVDAKCINSIRQTASSQTNVIENNKTNYSYSLIQNLAYTPINPKVNETMSFSFRTLSNYVDSSEVYNVLNTNVNASFYLNNNFLSSENIIVNGNNPTAFNSFSFNKIFNQPGNYSLVVVAKPINGQGNQIIVDSKAVTFIIANITPINPNPINQSNQTNGTGMNAPVITNIITDPIMPFVNNGSTQNLIVDFDSSIYPITIIFNLYNSTSLVDTQGGINVVNDSVLPITYIIPINLNNGIYFLNMTATNAIGNSSTYFIGSFTVNRTSVNNQTNNTDDDHHSVVRKKSTNFTSSTNMESSESLPLNSGNYTINLIPKESKVFDYKPWLYWLIIAILILLIIIVLLYILRYMK